MPRRVSSGTTGLLLSAILFLGGAALAAQAPSPTRPALEVAQGRWADAIQDRQPIGNYQQFAPEEPLFFWFLLHGTQAAVDNLRAGHPLRVVVHWRREGGGTTGAPELTTVLSVGEPGLADRLEHEVRQQGYFDWPAWARKETLSPGRWQVSLTDPDGYPLPCATPQGACRFTISIG
jgi:hypothetical protein